MSEMVERFWRFVARGSPSECWPWQGVSTTNGRGIRYGMFRNGKMVRAHRLAYQIAHGHPVPTKMVVRHSCDNGLCCNPAHLVMGTQKDNVADRYARNRHNHVRGSAHGVSKLHESDIPKIRALLRSGWSQRRVANQLSVSTYTIQDIAHGRRWKHVND